MTHMTHSVTDAQQLCCCCNLLIAGDVFTGSHSLFLWGFVFFPAPCTGIAELLLLLQLTIAGGVLYNARH